VGDCRRALLKVYYKEGSEIHQQKKKRGAAEAKFIARYFVEPYSLRDQKADTRTILSVGERIVYSLTTATCSRLAVSF
jgi:hypothetical protein